MVVDIVNLTDPAVTHESSVTKPVIGLGMTEGILFIRLTEVGQHTLNMRVVPSGNVQGTYTSLLL